MGNKGEGGPFAPLVRLVRGVMGQKEFNQFRGKAISAHSQGERWRESSGGRGDGGGMRGGGGGPVGESNTHTPPADPHPPSPPSLSVIKEFGKSIGVDNKQVQGLIRLAKKNGEKLGFLA